VDFGVVLQTDPPASRVVELAAKAEALGFGYGWTFDSHVLWEEPFVIYSQMLAATERMIVGPMVTNPGTRDWTVIASQFATLAEMSDGRVVCGIGRGDSALRYIGRQPATLATTAEATRVIKDLVAGRTVAYNDKSLSIPWAEGRGWELPVWMAAYGPKALASTGTHYDGYILQLADPQVAAWTISAVRQAAEEAGRDPDSLTICVAAPAYVGEDVAHQRDEVRWFGGMVGNHVHDMVKRYGSDESKVPKVLADYIAAREGYDYDHHGKASNPSTDFVPDEIVDRFCLLGPPEAHLERLAELRELGVDQFAVYLMHDDKEGTLEAYGREIIPAMG